MWRFSLIFGTVLAALFALDVSHFGYTALVMPWTGEVARVSAALMGTLDHRVMAQGMTILNRENGFAVLIMPGCNGVEAVIVLAAAVLAFPAAWGRRAVGLLAGTVAIQALNIVRIVCLFYLGQWNRDYFEFAHIYLWPGLIMLDVLAIWIVWTRWATPRAATVAASPGGAQP